MRPLIKPSELARDLGVSRAWVYEGARRGRIPSIRIGGEEGPLRFISEDIERWLNEARHDGRPWSGQRIDDGPRSDGRRASARNGLGQAENGAGS